MEAKVTRVGKYEIGETLGLGSSGEVRQGTSLDGQVAIKLFNKFRDIRSELHVYKALPEHPNILKLLDYELYRETESRPYMVLELAQQDFFSYIEEKKQVPPQLARHFFKSLVNGLMAIHSSGIAHCDLKLENLFLFENSLLKIGDFGLSSFHKNDKINELKGSKKYISPEIILRRAYDPVKADIFSCGVILFVMLVGRFPFGVAYGLDALYKYVVDKDFEKFWSFHPKIDEEAKNLINSMIAFDPEERITLQDVLKSDWIVHN